MTLRRRNFNAERRGLGVSVPTQGEDMTDEEIARMIVECRVTELEALSGAYARQICRAYLASIARERGMREALTITVPLMGIADEALDKDTEEQIRKDHHYNPPDDAEIWIRAATLHKINIVLRGVTRFRAALSEQPGDDK